MDVDEDSNVNSSTKPHHYVPLMAEPEDGEPPTWDVFPFTEKKFNPVFFWSYDVQADNCAICRAMLMEPCLNCQVANKTSCVVAWGECGHAFHNDCMSAWIKSRSAPGVKCPLCQSDWIIQRASA